MRIPTFWKIPLFISVLSQYIRADTKVINSSSGFPLVILSEQLSRFSFSKFQEYIGQENLSKYHEQLNFRPLGAYAWIKAIRNKFKVPSLKICAGLVKKLYKTASFADLYYGIKIHRELNCSEPISERISQHILESWTNKLYNFLREDDQKEIDLSGNNIFDDARSFEEIHAIEYLPERLDLLDYIYNGTWEKKTETLQLLSELFMDEEKFNKKISSDSQTRVFIELFEILVSNVEKNFREKVTKRFLDRHLTCNGKLHAENLIRDGSGWNEKNAITFLKTLAQVKKDLVFSEWISLVSNLEPHIISKLLSIKRSVMEGIENSVIPQKRFNPKFFNTFLLLDDLGSSYSISGNSTEDYDWFSSNILYCHIDIPEARNSSENQEIIFSLTLDSFFQLPDGVESDFQSYLAEIDLLLLIVDNETEETREIKLERRIGAIKETKQRKFIEFFIASSKQVEKQSVLGFVLVLGGKRAPLMSNYYKIKHPKLQAEMCLDVEKYYIKIPRKPDKLYKKPLKRDKLEVHEFGGAYPDKFTIGFSTENVCNIIPHEVMTDNDFQHDVIGFVLLKAIPDESIQRYFGTPELALRQGLPYGIRPNLLYKLGHPDTRRYEWHLAQKELISNMLPFPKQKLLVEVLLTLDFFKPVIRRLMFISFNSTEEIRNELLYTVENSTGLFYAVHKKEAFWYPSPLVSPAILANKKTSWCEIRTLYHGIGPTLLRVIPGLFSCTMISAFITIVAVAAKMVPPSFIVFKTSVEQLMFSITIICVAALLLVYWINLRLTRLIQILCCAAPGILIIAQKATRKRFLHRCRDISSIDEKKLN